MNKVYFILHRNLRGASGQAVSWRGRTYLAARR